MVPCQGAGIPVLSTVAEEMGRARGQLVPSTQSLEEAHSHVLGCLGDTAGPSPCAQGPPVGCSQSRFLEGTTSLGLTGAGQLGNCCITSHRKQRKGWEWMCGGMRKSRVAWPAARRWGAPQRARAGRGWTGTPPSSAGEVVPALGPNSSCCPLTSPGGRQPPCPPTMLGEGGSPGHRLGGGVGQGAGERKPRAARGRGRAGQGGGPADGPSLGAVRPPAPCPTTRTRTSAGAAWRASA